MCAHDGLSIFPWSSGSLGEPGAFWAIVRSLLGREIPTPERRRLWGLHERQARRGRCPRAPTAARKRRPTHMRRAYVA